MFDVINGRQLGYITTLFIRPYRPLRIILPGRSYGEAQEMLQCPSLDIRRGKLCEKTMKKIALDGRLSRHL